MKIHICSELAASRIVPAKGMVLISITNPGKYAALQPGWTQLLRVSFMDANYDQDAIRHRPRKWHLSSKGYMTKQQAMSIREFMDSLDESTQELVIHCGASLNRSAAVAIYAAQRFGVTLDAELTHHNLTVLRLLQNPGVFDASLPTKTPSMAKTARFWLKRKLPPQFTSRPAHKP